MGLFNNSGETKEEKKARKQAEAEAKQESHRCLRCDHFGYGIFKGGRKEKWEMLQLIIRKYPYLPELLSWKLRQSLELRFRNYVI